MMLYRMKKNNLLSVATRSISRLFIYITCFSTLLAIFGFVQINYRHTLVIKLRDYHIGQRVQLTAREALPDSEVKDDWIRMIGDADESREVVLYDINNHKERRSVQEPDDDFVKLVDASPQLQADHNQSGASNMLSNSEKSRPFQTLELYKQYRTSFNKSKDTLSNLKNKTSLDYVRVKLKSIKPNYKYDKEPTTDFKKPFNTVELKTNGTLNGLSNSSTVIQTEGSTPVQNIQPNNTHGSSLKLKQTFNSTINITVHSTLPASKIVNDSKLNDAKYIGKKLNRLKSVIVKLKQLELNSTLPAVPRNSSDCDYFRRESLVEREVHEAIWSDLNTYEDFNITLVTQLTWRRLSMLSLLLEHWEGPVSAAVYVEQEFLDAFFDHVQESAHIITRSNVDFHIVLANGTLYPINFLRNIALDNVMTTHVFLSDVDFIPSKGLHSKATTLFETNDVNEYQVLVLPAMEFVAYSGSVFPESKAQLRQLWKEGIIITSESIHWPPGHRATNYSVWKNATQPYEVRYEIDYEPYIIGKKSELPAYNEAFFEGQRDKTSHLFTVNATGFGFVVLPDHFVIHYPHVRIPKNDLFICSNQLYADLLRNYSAIEEADRLLRPFLQTSSSICAPKAAVFFFKCLLCLIIIFAATVSSAIVLKRLTALVRKAKSINRRCKCDSIYEKRINFYKV